MTSVAQLMILTIFYYILVGIMVFSLSIGGMFEDTNTIQGSFNSLDDGGELLNLTLEPAGGWDYLTHTAGGFIDVWKFFRGFGLDLGLGGFGNFLVTLIFGWLPAMVSALLVVFAIRSGSS